MRLPAPPGALALLLLLAAAADAGPPSFSQARLVPSDTASSDNFGGAIAVSGDTIIVGAPNEDENGTDAGAAYVFVLEQNMWMQQAKLFGDDTVAGDGFGVSVAIDGDVAVTGANRHDTGGTSAGAAYVFRRTGSAWAQEDKLAGDDTDAGDQLGASVAVDGDLIAVGANLAAPSGAVYVFERAGGDWVQDDKLAPMDSGPEFGISVGVSGNTLVAGAYLDGGMAPPGAAFVFVRNGGSWSQQQKLVAADGVSGDLFGRAVAIDGDVVVAGAPNDTLGFSMGAGSAYVFRRSGTTWTEEQKLLPSPLAPQVHFGTSVDVLGDTVIVGQPEEDTNPATPGAVYVFERAGMTWTQQAKPLAEDGANDDAFGSAVALDGEIFAAGAPFKNAPGADSGAAYALSASILFQPTFTPAAATATPSATSTRTATPTATRTPTASVTATNTASPTPTPSHTPTATATPSATPTRTPTNTGTSTATPSRTPTITPAPTHTPTVTPTRTPSPTLTPTRTPTSTPTRTPSRTPTSTPTPSRTPTPSPSATPSPTRTATASATRTPSSTPTRTATASGTPDPTTSPTRTPSSTPSATSTATHTRTHTRTHTHTHTHTRTPTISATPSVSPSPSHSLTPTPLMTVSATPTRTSTTTPTPTHTPSGSPFPSATTTRTATAVTSPSATLTPSRTTTPGASATPTAPPEPTATTTATPPPSGTETPPDETPSASATPTFTPEPTETAPRSATPTLPPSATATLPPSATPTLPPSATATAPAPPTSSPSPEPAGGAGDANCDGRINAADLPAAIAALGTADPGLCGGADADADGDVDDGDVDLIERRIFAPPHPIALHGSAR